MPMILCEKVLKTSSKFATNGGGKVFQYNSYLSIFLQTFEFFSNFPVKILFISDFQSAVENFGLR